MLILPGDLIVHSHIATDTTGITGIGSMTAWIRMISDSEAAGAAKEALDSARTPHGTVDNVLRVHSLRPHTMYGHTALYRSVLHNPNNSIPLWFLETAGTYTSILKSV